MSSYSGIADRPDRAKAIAAVVVVHVALALVILSGLNVKRVGQAVDQLTTTIEIREEPPPPPLERPKPAPKPQPLKKPQGAAAKKATPTPIVAPQPKIPQQTPIPTSKTPSSGTAPNSGAALAGSGSGAGGSGNGSGGGGYGDYSRFTPARLVSNIPNSQYSRLAATGIPSGAVGVLILVNTNGTVSNCRIARSSGDPAIDSLVCALTERFVRFDPARDPYGRPVAQDITYFPNWRRR
ncbi:MAG TPA: TonB family protein [Sphingomicrobium sp.]|nr:TonB family protein [Sphingomicrobium sp.]